MNLFKKIVLHVAIVGSSFGAMAQGVGDYFARPKHLIITQSTNLTQSGITTLLVTNVVDVSRFNGIANLSICVVSNSATTTSGQFPTNLITLQFSNNGTNGWATITNVAYATQYALTRTNYYGTTNSQSVTSVNLYNAPGVVTTPVNNQYLFAGQYIVPAQFTNSASSTINGSTNLDLGINMTADGSPNYSQGYAGMTGIGQYISIIYQVTGSNAQYSVSAELHGQTTGGVY